MQERILNLPAGVPSKRIWWSAVLGGAFFGLGIMLILSFFGLAIGSALGATRGAAVWSGMWSLVTLFVGFFAGGWLAARLSGTQTKTDGRLHGLVVWGLGTTAIIYFAINSTARIAGMLAGSLGNVQANVAPGQVANITITAATWALISLICGLVGAIAGGNAGGYREIAEVSDVRRAA